MADRPILFSAPMVRALLAGTKTQTRRVLPNPEYYGCPTGDCPHDKQAECNAAMQENALPDVRFTVGDRLWVKETWRTTPAYDDLKPSDLGGDEPLNYLADDGYFNWAEADGAKHGKTRVSIFMPRWASRLTMTVTDVRVERLQDISEADAMAEGIETEVWDHALAARDYSQPEGYFVGWPMGINPPSTSVEADRVSRESYRTLWNSINGKGAWDANPWVVAVSFDVRKGNIDG